MVVINHIRLGERVYYLACRGLKVDQEWNHAYNMDRERQDLTNWLMINNEQRFARYLRILGLEKERPSHDYLCELVATQLKRVPFENISKLYYRKRNNLRGLINFDLHLDGLEQYNFGGTCYANNYYLNCLLNYLGFKADLCGADMTEPDVHVVNLVQLDSREYLVDVGYGAPFGFPMARDLETDLEIKQGNEKYVLKPQDTRGVSAMEQYRDGELVHGYRVNPTPKRIESFHRVIADSFDDEGMFMTNLRAVRFYEDRTISLRNLTLTDYTIDTVQTEELTGLTHVLETIVEQFEMPADKVRYAVTGLANLESPN